MDNIIDIEIGEIAVINEFSSEFEFKFRLKNRKWDGFVYFDEGEGFFHSENGEMIQIKRSTLIFLRAGDSYYIQLEPGYHYIASAYMITKDKSMNISSLGRSVICNASEGATVKNIYDSWKIQTKSSLMNCKIALLSLYLELINKTSSSAKTVDAATAAMEYIEANFKRNFTSKEISSYCKVSESHLRLLFRKRYGKTITEYREFLRANEAKKMLRTSLFTLKEIGYELGYNDVYHFTKSFRRSVGITPGAFSKEIATQQKNGAGSAF